MRDHRREPRLVRLRASRGPDRRQDQHSAPDQGARAGSGLSGPGQEPHPRALPRAGVPGGVRGRRGHRRRPREVLPSEIAEDEITEARLPRRDYRGEITEARLPRTRLPRTRLPRTRLPRTRLPRTQTDKRTRPTGGIGRVRPIRAGMVFIGQRY
ncbi:hypothetical protein ETD86_22675 [Nonomuraea turkmeniaca]|uniref:Uncharacterized protein n=1 Tax=Nonomuraea turkmeniaca TaxID=103838 RepID=A0A5S4FFY2_9ACTN|nr:hypothetical protein ETD86_22675 [Nonomuraea turkmeniaca]